MDPNVTLSGARDAAQTLITALDAGDDDTAVLHGAQWLADTFTALDGWLAKGGFLPDAWRTPLVPECGVNPLVDQMLWDVFVTALEGGVNDWAACKSYRCFKDDNATDNLDGFYAEIIDADYREGDPDAEFPLTRIDRALMAKAFERVAAGPIEGWHESYRNKFLMMLQARLAGMDDNRVDVDYDAYDAQGLVQVGMFSKVIFG
jgi:hypothetical protein